MAQFGAPNFLAAIDAYEAGARRAERNRLAELAEQGRVLQGKALSGDQNALAQLGQVDPQAYMATSRFTTEQKKARLGEFLSAAYGAKTPEQWQSVVERFKAQGHQFGPGEDAWENRENLIRQGMSVADQMGMDLRSQQFAAETARDQRNFQALQNYRAESLANQRAAIDARTQQGVPSGYRRTADGNLEGIPGGPADPKVKASLKGGGPMSASMLKLKRETENGIVDLENTKAVLGRALGLAPKTFSGFGAGTRAYLGSRLPDGAVPDIIADKAGADATTEFGNIMSMEAIQSMSNSLKGATTDFELRKFEQILSDPTVPVNIKQATIRRMLTLADSKLALEQQRLEEFGAEMPESQSPPQQQGSTDTQQQNTDFFIQQANDAIAAGADPEAVMQRLRDMGIETEVGQ
jgi:hypothetical protein